MLQLDANDRMTELSEVSEPFPVTKIVKHGCVMAPTLSVMASCYLLPLTNAYPDRVTDLKDQMVAPLFSCCRRSKCTRLFTGTDSAWIETS